MFQNYFWFSRTLLICSYFGLLKDCIFWFLRFLKTRIHNLKFVLFTTKPGNARSIWRYRNFKKYINESLDVRKYVWDSRTSLIISYFGLFKMFTFQFPNFQSFHESTSLNWTSLKTLPQFWCPVVSAVFWISKMMRYEKYYVLKACPPFPIFWSIST